jgi:hypothetical protein
LGSIGGRAAVRLPARFDGAPAVLDALLGVGFAIVLPLALGLAVVVEGMGHLLVAKRAAP